MQKVNEQPLVSVIMPVYNAGAYLAAAIESILHQTYQHFELIIINDASTDASAKIIRKYRKQFPDKIITVRLKQNLNAGGDTCANLGLALASGKYIARMDADDIAHPTRLENQVLFLEAHPEISLVGSNAYVIDKNGTVIGEKIEPLTHSEIRNQYFTFHPLIHPSTMYRRIIQGKPFRYRIRYSANNDYYTFFSLLCEGERYANLEEKLLYYRIHGKNDTFMKMKQKFLNTIKIRMRMIMTYGYRPSAHAVLMTVIQAGVVLLLPEALIAQLYFLMKGIRRFSLPKLPSFIPSIILQHSS